MNTFIVILVTYGMGIVYITGWFLYLARKLDRIKRELDDQALDYLRREQVKK